MKKIIPLLLAVLLAAPVLSAQEYEGIFHLFLLKLVERHEELKTLAMPNIETHTTPEIPDEAFYILTFNTRGNIETFITALKKENIVYGTFTKEELQDELQLGLFYSDLALFLMKVAMGF